MGTKRKGKNIMKKHNTTPELYQTLDYEIFELHEYNRPVMRTKDLEQSMIEFGFIPGQAMHCVQSNNGKVKIKDGHHRLFVAKKLGISVWYIVSNDTAKITDINIAKGWSCLDYLASYCQAGIPEYLALKEYMGKTGISIMHCISMMAGQSAGSNNHLKSFKGGYYKLGDQSHANKVGNIVIYCRNIDIECAIIASFVRAISKIVWVNEIDIEILRHKLKTHKSFVEKQTSVDGYVGMIESIYNRQNKNKIPLSFLADKAAKERSDGALNQKRS